MPFVESFLTTIKSNTSIMLDKSRHFKKTLGGFKWSENYQFNFPKATPEVLESITFKLQEEKKKRAIKLNIILLIIVVFGLAIILNL